MSIVEQNLCIPDKSQPIHLIPYIILLFTSKQWPRFFEVYNSSECPHKLQLRKIHEAQPIHLVSSSTSSHWHSKHTLQWPAWHGFNDIPQNISINNFIANRLKEHLLYQVNQFLQPKLKCLTYMWLRLGLLILIQTHFHRSFSNFWVYSEPISTKFTILWITRTLLRHFQISKPQLETKKIIETFNTRWRCEKNSRQCWNIETK